MKHFQSKVELIFSSLFNKDLLDLKIILETCYVSYKVRIVS